MTAGAAARGAIELRLPGGRLLMVRRGFDRQVLVDVIRALEVVEPAGLGSPA